MSFRPYDDGIGIQKDGARTKPQVFVTGDGWGVFNLARNLARLAAGKRWPVDWPRGGGSCNPATMTSQPTSGSHKAERYQPTEAELNTAADMVKRLTPSADAYATYRRAAGSAMGSVKMALPGVQDRFFEALRLWRSKVFVGHEYLLGVVPDEDIESLAPNRGAICLTITMNLFGSAPGMQIPPLMLIPSSKRRSRSVLFTSTVEHEIVHVNQALLGTSLNPPVERRAEDLVEFLVGLATAEYEAAFVQLARWPAVFPPEPGATLHHWCILQGYIQALEHVLTLVAQQDYPEDACLGFLEALEFDLSGILRRVGACVDVVPWFLDRLLVHVALVVRQVLSRRPLASQSAAFRAAAQWLLPRLEAARNAN